MNFIAIICLLALPVVTGLGSVLWSKLADVSWRLPALANMLACAVIYAITVVFVPGSIKADMIAMYKNPSGLWISVYVAAAIVISFLWLFALRDSGIAAIAFVEIGYPLFILFFAFLFFGEAKFNIYHAIGGITVFIGTCIVLLGNIVGQYRP